MIPAQRTGQVCSEQDKSAAARLCMQLACNYPGHHNRSKTGQETNLCRRMYLEKDC